MQNIKDLENIIWYKISSEETIKKLESSDNGLSEEESQIRIEQFGKNELISEKKDSILSLLLEQFKNVAVIILIIAAIVSIFIGEALESISILIIVFLAAILGFFQEYQAGKAIDSLNKMSAPNANIIRNGIEKVITASELAIGDIFTLKAGDRIPADSRIIESNNLKVDEAALTGESLAVEKNSELINSDNLPLGDRKNMLFSGTTVSYGRAKAIAVSTGMKTEFGKIAKLLQETESNQTPLQKNINNLSKWFGIFSILLAVTMSVIGLFKGYSLHEMVMWGISLAVALMPEALPAVVTISLAIGVKRMVKKRALIRTLPSVETLGATSIICTDKTGTLTKDEMTIRKIFIDNQEIDVTGAGYEPNGDFLKNGNIITLFSELNFLLKAGVLCNDSQLINENNIWDVLGDPTEAAIIVTAEKAGIKSDIVKKEYLRVGEIPFSSEAKKMTTFHKSSNSIIGISKGAPEVILDSCKYIRLNGQIVEINNELKNKVNEFYDKFANEALRVIALSTNEKRLESNIQEDFSELRENMVFEGLFGMIDPPRTEVKEAIKICNQAKIKPVMITGDHKITAMAIGRELGILKNGNALSGSEIEKLSNQELNNIIENTEVFARISPEHKLRIVNSFMDKGYVVAMTGDGVNDAPALKRANIGIAMGITGTDVSREASDIVLTDDNFASIVSAVEEGRGIFENIKKYLVFLISGNLGTIIGLTSALFLNLQIPLNTINILYINFIMDGLVAIALGIEPPEKGIMKRSPRNVNKGIMDNNSILSTIITSIVIGTILTLIYILSLNNDTSLNSKHSSTIFFMTLIIARIFNGFNCTSLTESVINIRYYKNKYLLFACLLSLLMTLPIIYLKFFNDIFKTIPLNNDDWIRILIYGVFVTISVEIYKKISKVIGL
ncbi:MAG: cation-translocating P-type ATPase [Candidatus Sericytochromatia bacterium]